jgi:putative copper export protein
MWMNLLEPMVLIFTFGVFVAVLTLALFNRLAARHDREHWPDYAVQRQTRNQAAQGEEKVKMVRRNFR